MRTAVVRGAMAALAVVVLTGGALAGPISGACNKSARSAATPSLCSCLQKVADQTLRGDDQRRVATFFRDPDKAQVVKMSTKSGDDRFWQRYELFGQQAELVCLG